MHFEVVGEITGVVTIAAGRGIRDLARLRRRHGPGRWRKRKGVAIERIRKRWREVSVEKRVSVAKFKGAA